MAKAMRLEDRLFSKIKKTKSCWLWTGAKLNSGYGFLGRTTTNPKIILAHRGILIIHGIDIPRGMCVDHICRVRHCVNPGHLRVVTRSENTLQNSLGITAENKRKAKCPKGHPLFGPNLYEFKNKKGNKVRFCKECRSKMRRKYYIQIECGLNSTNKDKTIVS